MSAPIELCISADGLPLHSALDALLQLAERFPERVELLLRGIGGASKLIRLDMDVLPASGASDLRVRFQPSDALLRFLAAMRAVDADFVAVDDGLHERSMWSESVGGTSILSTCEGSPIQSGAARASPDVQLPASSTPSGVNSKARLRCAVPGRSTRSGAA